ncbi:MAG: preprotein translocase subunit SecG [Blastomonas sp.]
MSSLFLFFTIVQALVAAALVGVILMQRSEGGGLAGGGSPSGLMSARGAADFLTRTTTFLAIMFVSLSIVLAVLAAGTSSSGSIDTSLDRNAAEAGAVPAGEPADPLAGATGEGGATEQGAAPAGDAADPLADVDQPAPASGE